MLRDRVDTLEGRVRRLREVIEHLDEEHATVRKRVRALEDSVDGSHFSDGCLTQTTRARSASPATGPSEASDEEVAAAISAIEDASEERSEEDRSDDLIVA